MFADSDHAGCKRTRRSTTCGALMFGGHLIRAWCLTQALVSISSGESEFYASVEAVIELLYFNHFLDAMRDDWHFSLYSDSVAARGMVKRVGTGARVKHIATNHPFVQQHVRAGDLAILAVLGLVSPADIGTKYVTAYTLKRLFVFMGLGRSPYREERGGAAAEKGQNVTGDFGSFDLGWVFMQVGTMIAISIMLIGFVCRRCQRHGAKHGDTEGTELDICGTKSGGVYHRHAECSSTKNAQVQILMICKHCASQKRRA